MVRLYLGCYVYEDLLSPVWMRYGCCDEFALDKIGIQSVAAPPAGLLFIRKYAQGEAKGLPYRSANALVFPLPAAPNPGRPNAIDFMVTGKVITNGRGRNAARNTAAFSDVILIAAEKIKANDYQLKVRAAWKRAFQDVPCPGSDSGAPLPAGGLKKVTGFQFYSAIFDTFG